MSQLQKKFIADSAIDGTKILLLNGQTLRGRNVANSADFDILKVTSGDILEFQNLPYAKSSLAIPSAPKQFATIEYIQNFVSGKGDAKDAVDALAATNVTLTGSTPFTVDGYTFAATTPVSRVLLTAQTSNVDNGIYDVTITGGTYTLTRSSDFNGTGGNVSKGAYTFVVSGTVYQGWEALLTTADPITVGSSALVFSTYPSSVSLIGGDMISKVNNVFSVDLAPLGGLVSTDPGNSNGQLKVLTDTAALEKDQTTRLDPTSGFVATKKSKKATFTLSSTDITNQYVDLSDVAATDSIMVQPTGGPVQNETDDYTVNYTGGSSSKTRISFVGGLATGGVSALVSGDKVVVYYRAF